MIKIADDGDCFFMSLFGKRKSGNPVSNCKSSALRSWPMKTEPLGDPTIAAHCTKGGRGVGDMAKRGLAKLCNYAEVKVPSHRDGLYPAAMGTH